MIFLNRNTVNQIVLTLSENVTITNPYFIFSFQHYATLTDPESIIYFTAPDDSNYTNRYNIFELTESDSGSTSGGNDVDLYLKPGQYEYKVYQSTTASLDPNGFGSLLETGKMVVGDMTVEGQDTAVLEVYQ